MKIQITRNGVFNNQNERVPVGTILEVDKEPTGWANKYKVLSKEPSADAEIVPAEVKPAATTVDDSGADDDDDDPVEALRARYQELSGEEADKRWGAPKLTSEIEALENGNDNE